MLYIAQILLCSRIIYTYVTHCMIQRSGLACMTLSHALIIKVSCLTCYGKTRNASHNRRRRCMQTYRPNDF